MSDRPSPEHLYATALRALRLMDNGSRADFDRGSALLTEMGEEANPVLALISRQLLTGVSVLSDRDRSAVLDHLDIANIANAEGIEDDDE